MNQLFNTVRTDLALEAREMLTKRVKEDIPGVLIETGEDEDAVITRVHISTPEAERVMGKAQGRYITIEAPGMRYKNTPLQQKIMNFLQEID